MYHIPNTYKIRIIPAGKPMLNALIFRGTEMNIKPTTVIRIAKNTRYFCSKDTLAKNLDPPKTNATAPKVNRFIILAPNTLPMAIAGLGGFSDTAEIFVDNSGREVANATKILPTNNLPNPVSSASASPYTANFVPQYTTTPALTKNIMIATIKSDTSNSSN